MELKERYTIVIVTHNMQQAVRISDRTAFFLLGELVDLCRREGSICRMAVRKPDGKTAVLAAVRFHEK